MSKEESYTRQDNKLPETIQGKTKPLDIHCVLLQYPADVHTLVGEEKWGEKNAVLHYELE